MKTVVKLLVALAVVGGAVYYVMSGSGGGTDLGQGVPEGASVVAIGEVTGNPEAYKEKEVTVKGKIASFCPTTGCWAVVEDGTGSIRYDSAAFGWALPPGQGGKEITVHGRVSVSEEGAPEIAASGARL